MRTLEQSEFYVNFYEIHETQHSIYMIIDYLRGGELHTVTKKKEQHSEEIVRKLIRNLLRGLK